MPDLIIGAVVLAAGLSTRMGQPKMVMPWGAATVIGQVVSTLTAAGVEPVIVVTGGTRAAVEAALVGQPVRIAYNPEYANGEMVASIQAGIAQFDSQVDGFLLALGDQPQMEETVVRQVMSAYAAARPGLVVPSVNRRRGHPWLVDRSLWAEILALKPPETMRDFLNRHQAEIVYVDVGSATILMDLDTPEDYQRQAPT
jgi:molybdenum cofactor cytidylyltransferase